MTTDFHIEAQGGSREPEWRVTYEERAPDGTAQKVVGLLVPGELRLGSLARWDEPDVPMDARARDRVVERMSAWALEGSGPVRVDLVFGAGTPVRVRDGTFIQAPDVISRRRFMVYEEGRSLDVPTHHLVPAGGRLHARIYPARLTSWSPHGEPVTDDDRARIAERIGKDGAVQIGDVDPWSLAPTLRDWQTSLVGLVPDASAIAALLGRDEPPPFATLLWTLELPSVFESGRTGWNLVPPHQARLGPIADDAPARIASWLFADDLPVSPRGSGGTDPNAESRMLLWSWASARAKGVLPPAEIAGFVLGVVVEHEGPSGHSALAVYADGRIRWVGPETVVVVDVDVSPEVTALGRTILAAAAEAGSAPRVTALTLGGRRPVSAAAEEIAVRAATTILATLIERLAPP